MNQINLTFRGLKSCFQAIPFVFEKGIWPFFFAPLFIRILTLLSGFFLAAWLGDLIAGWISDWLGLDANDGSNGFLGIKWGGILSLFLSFAIKLFLFFLQFYFTKYITLIILSPVLALISELTEEKISGKKFPFNFNQFVKDILRGLVITFRNMFFEIIITLLILLISLIPLVGFVSPFILIVVSAYYTGASLMDYNCERNKMNINESIRFMRQNKGSVIGIGLFYSLLVVIPWLGFIFIPVFSATGGTIEFLNCRGEGLNNE